MTRWKFFGEDPHPFREQAQRARELADLLRTVEADLVEHLAVMDERRTYVRFGYRSLRTYCNLGLRLPKAQCQRIATLVRRTRWDTEPLARPEDDSLVDLV